jgi:multicomponent Na+:H+ antiporter subunit F
MADMSFWLVAALALLIGLLPCGLLCVRGKAPDLLVAVELSAVICVLTIVMLAEGTRRPSLYDLALGLALLSFPGGLVFAHFLERWL